MILVFVWLFLCLSLPLRSFRALLTVPGMAQSPSWTLPTVLGMAQTPCRTLPTVSGMVKSAWRILLTVSGMASNALADTPDSVREGPNALPGTLDSTRDGLNACPDTPDSAKSTLASRTAYTPKPDVSETSPGSALVPVCGAKEPWHKVKAPSAQNAFATHRRARRILQGEPLALNACHGETSVPIPTPLSDVSQEVEDLPIICLLYSCRVRSARTVS